MGRPRGPATVQAGPGRRWRIEDRSQAGPSRRIGEANGAKDRDTVEEVAVEEARMPRANDGMTAYLQPKTATNLPHKPARSVSISTIEERLIELRRMVSPNSAIAIPLNMVVDRVAPAPRDWGELGTTALPTLGPCAGNTR
jgi:hypothetical protein